jgi:large subunit ribosomal protein L18
MTLKRRREGRTDYRRRLRLLASGKVRCVVRLTSRHSIIQFVEYAEQKDHVLTGATSKELVPFGWSKGTASVTAAYLAGYLAGTKAKAMGIEESVADVGFVDPRSNERLRACIKGVIDSGVNVPFGLECDESRLRGEHIGAGELFDAVVNSIKGGVK